jgi:hypothetical protein
VILEIPGFVPPVANPTKFVAKVRKTTFVEATCNGTPTLYAARLVSPDGDFKLTVTVDELRVRGTFNAIFWGFMAGSDHLNGTATLTRLDGKPVGNFKVTTSYALGGFAGGQDSSRLVWLYEEFAKMLTQELVALRDQKAKP